MSHVSSFRANGLDVWIDESGIDASNDWAEQIVGGITACDVFVLFLSKTSIESENVRKEIGVAASLGKRILPLKIEDLEIPPTMLYHLHSIHFLETKRVSQEQLLEHVFRAVGKPNERKPVVVAVKKSTSHMRVVLAVGVLLAVGLSAAWTIFLKRGPTAVVPAHEASAATTPISAPGPVAGLKPAPLSGGRRIAVLYFENNATDRQDLQPLAKGLAHMISCEAGKFDGYDIVEREELAKVLKELDLSNSKNFNASSAAKIGKLLGAEQLVFGSFMVLFDKFRIDAKIVDVETGRIVRAQSAKGDPQNFDVMVEELAGRLFSTDKVMKVREAGAVALPVDVALQIGAALQKIDEGNRAEGLELLTKLQQEHPESEILKRAVLLAK